MKLTKEGIAIIERDTHISKWVEESGRLDHDQNALPIILKEINPGDVVFDIGAYIGDHTIAYARKAHVVAFEPNSEAFECLIHNTRNKGVMCYPIAFSDKQEPYSMLRPNDNIGMAYVVAPIEGLQEITETIDVFCSTQKIVPNLIKIDAEGMETKILEGGVITIMSSRPKLILEVNEEALIRQGSSRQQLLILLDEYGYTCRDIYGQPLESLSVQFDIICKPNPL